MAQEDVEQFHKMSQLFELSVSILQRMENPPSSESPEELAVFIQQMIAGACAIVAVFCWPSLFARIVLAIAILIYLNATL